MAASTAPIDGSQYLVQISQDGGTTFLTLGYQQDANVSISGETRELTAKNVCYWREYAPTASSWTLGGTAGVYTDGTPEITQGDLFKYINSIVIVKIVSVDCSGTEITGEDEYEGTAIITELSMDFPDKDTATYTYSFQGTGVLTQTVTG